MKATTSRTYGAQNRQTVPDAGLIELAPRTRMAR